MSAFFFLSCIVYILRCSCRIYKIVWYHEGFIRVCLCTNHFLCKALEFYSHVDRHCSLFVMHLIRV